MCAHGRPAVVNCQLLSDPPPLSALDKIPQVLGFVFKTWKERKANRLLLSQDYFFFLPQNYLLFFTHFNLTPKINNFYREPKTRFRKIKNLFQSFFFNFTKYNLRHIDLFLMEIDEKNKKVCWLASSGSTRAVFFLAWLLSEHWISVSASVAHARARLCALGIVDQETSATRLFPAVIWIIV